MSTEYSDRIYELWRESAEKFDYFMAGLCAALIGYLAPLLKPAKTLASPETAEYAALVAFLIALFCGFKRIESTVHSMSSGLQKIRERESRSRLSGALNAQGTVVINGKELGTGEVESKIAARDQRAAIVERLESEAAVRATRWYKARNNFLVVGFVLLLISKFWGGFR